MPTYAPAKEFNPLCYQVSRKTPRQRGKKGKAIPLQAWRGPEGSRRLRLPDFKTVGTGRW